MSATATTGIDSDADASPGADTRTIAVPAVKPLRSTSRARPWKAGRVQGAFHGLSTPHLSGVWSLGLPGD